MVDYIRDSVADGLWIAGVSYYSALTIAIAKATEYFHNTLNITIHRVSVHNLENNNRPLIYREYCTLPCSFPKVFNVYFPG